MNHDELAPLKWPRFPRTFKLLEDHAGCKTVIEVLKDDIVCHRVDNLVVESIVRYCWEQLAAVPGADVSYSSARGCKDLWWSLSAPLVAQPVALAEASYAGLTFRRLGFDAPVQRDAAHRLLWPDGPPNFMTFLSRCSAPKALCAFIGSLFYPQADRQQYLYLHGEGQDGKGSLLRMLYHLLGPAVQALQPKAKDDRFWNMKVYGKRLVMLPDVDDFRFFSSPEFKSMTGNDPVYFEEKGKMGFTAIPTCKFIVASNQKPNISSQKSDLRRLVYCEIKAVPDSERVAHFDRLLLAEAEVIVRLCKTVYEDACPEHGPIPCEDAIDVADDAEETAIAVFDQYFETASPECWAEGQAVVAILRNERFNDRDIRRLVQVWERKFGIQRKRTKASRRYHGMKRRSLVDDGVATR